MGRPGEGGGGAGGTQPPGSLWAPERRALTLGLVLTITFMAAEALAVVTIMPQVARSLGGLHLYGWVFSAFLLGSMVGIVAAGREADRAGPARPYVAGVVLFGAGLVVAGLAPTMAVLVVGRTLQGLGAGAVPAVAYVTIGRSFPEHLRARMMAVLSTAWVVPGIVGPLISAAVAHLFGWRWVFSGLVPLVAVTGALSFPGLARLGRPDTVPTVEHRLVDAVLAAAGTGLIIGGLTVGSLAVAGVLAVAGGAVLVTALRRLLPAGTLRARPGLPTTILSRGLLTFAYFGADAFVTLTIVTVRHHSLALAGVAVTGSTLCWTAGSWVQARLNQRVEGRRMVQVGLSLVLLGVAGMLAVLRPERPGRPGRGGLVGRRPGHGAVVRPAESDDAARGPGRPRGLGLGVPQPQRCAGIGPRRRTRGRGHRRRLRSGLAPVGRGGGGVRPPRRRRRGGPGAQWTAASTCARPPGLTGPPRARCTG